MSVYVDEVAVVMAISKIINMDGNVTVRSIVTQGGFKGKAFPFLNIPSDFFKH